MDVDKKLSSSNRRLQVATVGMPFGRSHHHTATATKTILSVRCQPEANCTHQDQRDKSVVIDSEPLAENKHA